MREWRFVQTVGLVAALAAPSAASGCGGGASSPIPPHQAQSTTHGDEDLFEESGDFAATRDKVFGALLDDAPRTGRMLGMHRFDARLRDYSKAGVLAHIARLKQHQGEMSAIDTTGLSPDEALDLALLQQDVALQLFNLVDRDVWRGAPAFYSELFEVNVYLDRDYAPIAQRAAKLLEHEKNALAQTKHFRENLKSPMSKPVVQTAIKIYEGYAQYLSDDVPAQLKGVGDSAFQAELKKTNTALAAEARAFAKFLKDVELPKGDDSHVLGLTRYRELLRVQEGLEVSLDEFSRMGEENLALNKKAYEALRPNAKVSRPQAKELLEVATKMSEDAWRFVREKDLVTIPSNDKAVVKETPPYQRWNSAFLDMAGPFEERVKGAFYYITMPDPSWPEKEQREYVMAHGILMSTTVHEIVPGHFLQGLFSNRAPTDVQKAASSYSFVEGWAHYAEEVMMEEGFGAEDPQMRLGQLSDALLRNCRFVVSLGVHTRGMTLDQAEKRFMTDCFQDKATAREQAVRATFDPGYFAYTLGKIQILQLRAEVKKKLGSKFDLKRFHDVLLSHGSPPVPLIRQRVLEELTGG